MIQINRQTPLWCVAIGLLPSSCISVCTASIPLSINGLIVLFKNTANNVGLGERWHPLPMHMMEKQRQAKAVFPLLNSNERNPISRLAVAGMHWYTNGAYLRARGKDMVLNVPSGPQATCIETSLALARDTHVPMGKGSMRRGSIDNGDLVYSRALS